MADQICIRGGMEYAEHLKRSALTSMLVRVQPDAPIFIPDDPEANEGFVCKTNRSGFKSHRRVQFGDSDSHGTLHYNVWYRGKSGLIRQQAVEVAGRAIAQVRLRTG